MRWIGWLLLAFASIALAQDFETRKSLEYATHDGVKLAGDLYLPKAPGAHPVIVAIHGGGWQIGGGLGHHYWGGYPPPPPAGAGRPAGPPLISLGGPTSRAAATRSTRSAIGCRSRDRRASRRRCMTCAPLSSSLKGARASCASIRNASA